MNSYKILNKQVFSVGDYSIVPIRKEDRYAIMKWRNEQMYHLRQNEVLTKEKQDSYFDTVIAQLFHQDKPEQILFSYLEGENCIGYGGLVHINWIDKNAEISFVLNTEFDTELFKDHWTSYLTLIEEVALKELKLHKIYTYAFDLRPELYTALESCGYYLEATLKNHCHFDDNFIDVVIHSKILSDFYCRKAAFSDAKLLYNWVNDPTVRRNSLSTDIIIWEDHLNWFYNQLFNTQTLLNIWVYKDVPIGQSRLDYINGDWLIDYSISKPYRGKGFGEKIIREIMNYKKSPLKAQVRSDNIGSIKIFQKLGFISKNISEENSEIIEFRHE
ncbi:GNAT family N-acetyltransferase [Salegentibacter sp. LM13S]|uniref:GNAT family N-acetyltransferase n=1 Tax=Salegentibacter lacus TaxID=2873599 RepID=UPI001CCD600E|nr:GNAT family N-acetyltransferase [Salegentibacter lacus]MBZ9631492.1 GNAT family N-acetyltransferase [Salegentibacter lacus]